ncbi:MAG TPA: hydrogenase expression/formation protein HypE [Acidobacteriaceae bacterium]|jgi:hydrogenase expression/formation protein HypE
MSPLDAVDEQEREGLDAVEGAVFGQCPLPVFDHPQIVMGHGSGGKLSAELIEKVFVSRFANPTLERMNDSALLEIGGARLAFTTDSFVVTPIFFPGGDIGSLAVNGTVNDLAMAGAKPLYLSAAFILEEGLLACDLTRVVDSMQAAATYAGVQLVTGDTKVVNRGKGDQIFITTTGLGQVPADIQLSADRAQPGDKILLSGYIGDHGITILSQRENLEFEADLQSDCAALNSLVDVMVDEARAAGDTAAIRCLRDPTRGGVASTLNEIAARAGVGMMLQEDAILVRETVRGACEMLGLDPLYVANEGKLLAVVSTEHAEKILQRMHRHPLGKESRIIGQVLESPPGMVLMKTRIGGTRVVDTLFGEQLPRIC